MALYSYRLHKDNNKEITKKTYKESELKLMTTFALREICSREKLVKSIVDPLDKEELISLIMKYRGEKEKLLVNNYLLGGIERVDRLLKRSFKNKLNDKIIDYPSKITVYKDLAIDIFDNYCLKCNSELAEGNVLLVDENYTLCSILNLRKIKQDNNDKYYLTKGSSVYVKESQSRHYNLLLLSEEDSDNIYKTYEGDDILVNASINFYLLPILEMNIKEAKETELPLAIDFGTSNTTAGIYEAKEFFEGLINERKREDYEEENVKFLKILNEEKNNTCFTPIIPSVVGIKKISKDGNEDDTSKNIEYGIDEKDLKVKYIFGYDALRESNKRYVDDNLTVFYDIKRWVSDFDKYEKVIDVDGRCGFVKRKEIIKAYLEHIIDLANSQFKCKFKNVYISCPSKQKYKFHSLFKEILNNYNVKGGSMLEESVAVLYNTISELIQKKKYKQGQMYNALIIDCGGGTTDLTGCSFSIRNNRVSYEINIDTSYENGDTDFGGNNLTFRIMQFIKILLASKLNKTDSSLKSAIIDEFKIDVFRYIDKYGIQSLYESLNEEYEKAEKIIPTKFKLYEVRSKDDYCKVRSNYYFFWDLAENIKKTFFANPEILKIVLSPSNEKINEAINIKYDKWKLSYFTNNELKNVKDGPKISISTYEITTLIKGDIYNIMKKFLEKLYENDELYEYSLIKLTGQSCNVDIFKDALKEFIPGRIIEVNKNKKDEKEEYDLKLCCLKGAIKYLYDKNFGYADINIKSNVATLPYVLTAYTHTGEEKILIKGKSITKGFISRFMDKIILKLYLKDTYGNLKYEFNYSFDNKELEKVTAETIGERYPNINQHETDNIENNEIKFFVWGEEEAWGFYVLAILRHNDELYVGKEKLYYFENDEWEKNFFDGMN